MNMDLVSWIFDSQLENPDAPLLIDACDVSRSLSYNQLRSYVRRLVAGFHAAGVRPGDCICVNSFNDVFYNVLYLGVIGSGAIFTGVNPSYTSVELSHHFQLTKPKFLIVEPGLLEPALISAAELGLPNSNIYQFDVTDLASSTDIQSWDVLLNHGERDWVEVESPDTTVAHYAPTSGTGGLPKAAILTHSYHVVQAAARLTDESLPYTPRRILALPPFHVFATPVIPSSIRQGVTTYVMRRFVMEAYLDAVERFEITEAYVAPPTVIAISLCPHATKEKLQSLRQIWWGGAALRYKNQLPIYAMLHPDAKLQPVYGMTEVGWITCGLWPEKMNDDNIGRPLPGVFVKLIDKATGNEVKEGQSGIIYVKAPHMMLGYLHNEAATLAAINSEGWLNTGDIGHLQDGNQVFVTDREKDMIKLRCWQVSPVALEGVILQYHAVDDAAVIGIEKPDGSGEKARAYIIPHPGITLDIEDLKAFLRTQMARYKIPEEFVITNFIPKNPTGKILRRQLREQAAAEAGNLDDVSKADKSAEINPAGLPVAETVVIKTDEALNVAGSAEVIPEAVPQGSVDYKIAETSVARSLESKDEKSGGPWQRVRRMSNGSIRTISRASRSIQRFLSWLRSLLNSK